MKMIRLFLFLGLAAGILLTAFGLFQAEKKPLDGDAMALVNGEPISRELYVRVVEGLQQDRDGAPLSVPEQKRVLDRMIEEELLVQEAVAIGMASKDRLARGYLVQGMIDFVTQQSEEEHPSDGDLQNYYEEHRQSFARPGKISLRAMNFNVFAGEAEEPARLRAEKARAELRAGSGWEDVAQKYADVPVAEVPQSPLGATNVLEYLGPTVTRASFGQKTGEVGAPIRSQTGYVLVEVLQRWEDMVPPFESVREDVAAAWRRTQSDEALRDYVDNLRQGATTTLAPQDMTEPTR